jgi:NADH:ubiquinone oxidoreductase subunit 6 (subunit J)
MTIQQILFILFAMVVLGSAVLVVTTRNLFHAALFLVVSFFGVAGFYVLLEAGFFAATQVLIYIGAISILFIFAVMLTRDVITAQRGNAQWKWAAFFAGFIFVVAAIVLGPIPITIGPINFLFIHSTARDFGNVQWPLARVDPNGDALKPVTPTYISDLGQGFVNFNQYAAPFLLGGVLMLVAMIGAIWVAREMHSHDAQDVSPATVAADEEQPVQEPLPLPDAAMTAEKH